jgi:hypothetical protein
MFRSGRTATPETYHTNAATSEPVARQRARVRLSIRMANMALAFKASTLPFIRMLNPFTFKASILLVPAQTMQPHDL